MKKRAVLLFIILLTSSGLFAESLQDAYMEEYTFLKAQKNELKNRLNLEKSRQDSDISNYKMRLKSLQDKIISLDSDVKFVQKNMEDTNKKIGEKKDNSALVDDVFSQVKMTFSNYGVDFKDDNKTSLSNRLDKIFRNTISLYNNLSSIRTEDGKFFLKDGSATKGKIVKVGNIARYGVSSKGSGALAPAGNGAFKLWNQPGSDLTAKALLNGKKADTLKIFTYENDQKDIPYVKEKTYKDYLKGGGIIGYIILGLGAFGLLLVFLRTLFLMGAGSRVSKISKIVQKVFEENGTPKDALEKIKRYKGATARVIKTTLRNLGKDRGHIEDIVTESMLNESSSLDRFGSFIMVIAAVAPLLGLLGTVSGMIATFDIITEHGTGDPKLLSGGISEALVTTMFGLIVAIPLLLLGNLLSSWANGIKASMEGAALHVINLYEKYSRR